MKTLTYQVTTVALEPDGSGLKQEVETIRCRAMEVREHAIVFLAEDGSGPTHVYPILWTKVKRL